MISFQKSATASFVLSLTRQSRNRSWPFEDIQSVWAFLIRNGFRPYDPALFNVQIVQNCIVPNSMLVDPLYLRLEGTALWSDGNAYSYFAQIDPTYSDMTEQLSAWSTSYTHVNTGISQSNWPQIIAPDNPPPAGFKYGPSPTKQTLTVSGNAQSIVMNWPPVDDRPNGGDFWYGLTIHLDLVQPYSYNDYSTLCASLLEEVPLLDPGRTYAGLSRDNVPRTMRLTWHSQCPKFLGFSRPLPAETGTIGIYKSRTAPNYIDNWVTPFLNWQHTNIQGNSPGDFDWRTFYWEGAANATDFALDDMRFPLAAFGVPIITSLSNESAVGRFWRITRTGANPTILAPTDYGLPHLMVCVKSAVISRRDLSIYGRRCSYTLASNSWSIATDPGLPGVGQHIFSMATPGCIIGIYGVIRSIRVNGTAGVDVVPCQGTMAIGQSTTLYCLGQDRHNYAIDDSPAPISWSFSQRTGAIQESDLHANGSVATFIPTGAGSARIRATYSNGSDFFQADSGLFVVS